jgi:hypothetical protein
MMPTFRTEVGPEGKPVVKAMLHVKGTWPDDLNEVQKAAWNRATRAIDDLCDLYNDELAADDETCPNDDIRCSCAVNKGHRARAT